jgi:hypothetical protein
MRWHTGTIRLSIRYGSPRSWTGSKWSHPAPCPRAWIQPPFVPDARRRSGVTRLSPGFSTVFNSRRRKDKESPQFSTACSRRGALHRRSRPMTPALSALFPHTRGTPRCHPRSGVISGRHGSWRPSTVEGTKEHSSRLWLGRSRQRAETRYASCCAIFGKPDRLTSAVSPGRLAGFLDKGAREVFSSVNPNPVPMCGREALSPYPGESSGIKSLRICLRSRNEEQPPFRSQCRPNPVPNSASGAHTGVPLTC